MLKVEFVRDGKGRILGDVTTGFRNGDNIARDRSGRLLGHSNSRFGNTRDAAGCLVSHNRADVGLLFQRK